MAYKIKVPTLAEAKAAVAEGKHPYYHPCVGCGKACSTPTKAFWMKRVKEFGSIDKVYSDFKCRGCRKSKKEVRKEKAAAMISLSAAGEVISRGVRKPGDFVVVPDGCVGVSVWEGGKFLGTSFQKIF